MFLLETAHDDFTPVVFLGVQPTLMVVQASMPVNNLKEFVARRRPIPASSITGIHPPAAPEMVAPANLPRELVAKISADMLLPLDVEEMRASMNRMGIIRHPGGQERMRDALRTEVENATRVAREAKMVKE